MSTTADRSIPPHRSGVGTCRVPPANSTQRLATDVPMRLLLLVLKCSTDHVLDAWSYTSTTDDRNPANGMLPPASAPTCFIVASFAKPPPKKALPPATATAKYCLARLNEAVRSVLVP